MAKQIEAVYGEALFACAGESGKRRAWMGEAQLLLEIFKDNPELSLFLNHPGIEREEKIKTMEAIFRKPDMDGPIVSEELLRFLKVIVEKGSQNVLEKILRYFIDAVKEDCHIGVAHVTAPAELTARQKKAVEKRLLETTHYETLEIHYRMDPSLIGGLVIRIKDRAADGSVKRRLERMKYRE